jgi:two-component system cell cycle sensor histidine kinase/response regulator CckA
MKHRYMLLFFAVMLGICFFIFTSFYNQAKQEAIKGNDNEQLLYAKQAARGIEDFFNNWTRTLTALAESSSIINMDKAGKEDIELLFRVNQDRIRAITRMDAAGRIVYTFPFNPDAMGRNISYQDHVREIMRTHKPVVSNVFSAAQGYDTVALHVPVFRNKTYEGTIAITINFQALAKRYLEDIKIGNTGYAWMTSRDGTELYCPVPGHTGKSVFENCKDFPSILTMVEDMLKGHQGLTTYTFDKIRGDEIEIVKKHAAYMPINIGNTFWSIVVASSEDEIIASLVSFRDKLIAVVVFLLLGGVLVSYYGLKAWLIVGEEGKRKQAEQALRDSEERYRTILDEMEEGYQEVNLTGNFTFFNDAFLRIFGYSAEEMMGKHYSLFAADGEIAKNVYRAYNQMYKTGIPIKSFEWDIIRKDGARRTIEFYASTLRDSNDRPAAFRGIVRDITDRKRTEEALRESEERYKNFTEKSFAGLYVVQEGLFVFLNENAASFAGYTSEELTGKRWASIIHPDDRPVIKERVKNMLNSQDLSPYEFRIVTKDGQVRWIMETVSSISYEGKPAILGNSMDITARKLAESQREAAIEALQVIRERERGILLSVPHALFGVEQRRIFFANDAMEAVFGWKPEELTGKSTRVIFRTDEEWHEYGTFLYSRLATKPVVVFEWGIPFVRKDGSEFFCRMSVSRTGAELGENRRIVATFEDITDRKQAEEEKRRLEERLHHAEKMESIGTLAGGIAHDFNNLLMGIQGYASLTLLDLDPSHPHYERIKRIEEQVQSGADLTRQLLGFARGGRYEVKPADMNDIIKKTSSMFGRTKKEITIHRKYGKDLWSVEVDQGQMEQVFMNLYVNAWQAMPGGGELYLETENVLLDDEQAFSYTVQPGKYVKITVTDTGTGMDEKTRERIFDPFFTTKEMGRGTGLGLATVYGIIKGHKGMINVYSEPGHGTTFSIYLPASEKEVVKKQAATGTIARGTETILLVDDEKMVVEVTRELLESLGYRVYVAGSGQEAVAVYLERRKEIALVILDMIMPGISGGETFDRLREINPDIRVLLSSGYSINGEARTIMDRGCSGFLQKPFQLEKLSRKVREVLD